MNVKRILQILETWTANYPSLVVTLLWKVELHYVHNGELEASNRIMRLRAKAYSLLIDKYKAKDPDGIGVFEQEYKYCMFTFRKVHSPEKITEIKAKKEKYNKDIKEFYAKNKEANDSVQVENYELQAYTFIHENIIKELSGVKSLFDVIFANKKYDETENRSILDILEILAYDEEKQALCAENSIFYRIERNHIGYHEDSLKFRGITGFDGKQHLCPFRTTYGLFYRGQKKHYSSCYSSIDRNMSDADRFGERLKETAVKCLFKNHPTTVRYNEGLQYSLPNGKKSTFVYHIDFHALAQHYGVYTNLLDLTSDKMIAAFFACTGYNWQEDKYYAYTKKGHGVFYVYRDKNIFSKDSKISCVGMQPLSRPGAQSGYVLAMNEKEDFNNLCSESIAFTHDKVIAKQIYELVNLFGKPFVDDVMSKKAKEIVRGTLFSEDILEETIRTFYPNTSVNIINNWIGELNISITKDSLMTFTQQELEALNMETSDTEEQLRTMVYNRVIFAFT